ncbi:hypothetical protein LINPERPRIM_LOCUS15297 [Linum perenne]
MDTEMTETAAVLPPPNPSGDIRELLAFARQLINQGKPSQALQMVPLLYPHQSLSLLLYRMRLQESNSIDHLATLFAECAIAGTESSKPEVHQPPSQFTASGVTPNVHEHSILAETGRNQLVLDAFADGSSFICLQCGGLVSVNRRDEHFAYWCSN